MAMPSLTSPFYAFQYLVNTAPLDTMTTSSPSRSKGTTSPAGKGFDPSSSYILLVQRLIEECLLFSMDRQQCVEALARHANVKPIITLTVWNELEKENEEFFSSYFRRITEDRNEVTLEGTTAKSCSLLLLTEGEKSLSHYNGRSSTPTD